MNSNPFQIEPQNLSKIGEELSRVPFGKLLGNILGACVDAQENASQVAWDYTKTVLSRKTPMVFTFQEKDKLKRLEVPLVTIVPLPYLSINDVEIGFDANVEVNNSLSKQFMVQVNNESSEDQTIQTAKGASNMRIDINAGTTDLPAGLASLLEIMSGGIIVEDVEKPAPTVPIPPVAIPSSSSGKRGLSEIIDNLEQNESSLESQKPQTSSTPSSQQKHVSSASGTRSVEQVIDSIADRDVEIPLKPQSSGKPSVEYDAEHFSEEIDAKMKESAEKGHIITKPTGVTTVSVSSQTSMVTSSGGGSRITIPDRVAPSPVLPDGISPLLALHVNWTKPSRVRFPNSPYAIEDFDILSTILSALLWRRFNGPIKLYTDNTGYAYYDMLGMTDLWDGGVDTAVLEAIPDDIPADIFWAGAKLFAIQNQDIPFVMMDTDLMVWSDIRERMKGYDAMAYHPESLNETGCYIDYNFLKKPKGYNPNPSWDWTIDPYNTALTYYANKSFRNYYTLSAIGFMRGNTERPMEMVSQMVFAEQRVFAMCAKYQEIKVGTFLSSPYEDSPDFTHIWGGKDEARTNPSANNRLCSTLARTIMGNFKDIEFSDKVREIMKRYSR